MKLPIRNYTSTPLTLFIEPDCDQHEIPAGGEAIVTLDDDKPHSLDVHPENWVSLWNEGSAAAEVELFSTRQSLEPNRSALSEDLPDPEDHARSLSKDELLVYAANYGEGSREWIIAHRELGRRFPTRWQRLRPWLIRAVWVTAVVYLYFRWWG